MEIVKIVILALSALLLLFVGAMRLSNPKRTYLKNSGIKLENDVDLLNEMRGLSSVMFFAGVIIVLGIVIPKVALTSFVVGTLIFIGFAIGRLLSSSLDGKPNRQITQGLIFLLVLGVANLFCLINILT